MRFMETHCKEKRLIANVLEALNEVVCVGHISQGDALQLLLGVWIPGHIPVVSGCCVENFLRPRGWKIILLVAIRLSRMENLPRSECRVSILLEVLRHRSGVWKMFAKPMVIGIAPCSIRPPSSQERWPAGSTQCNLFTWDLSSNEKCKKTSYLGVGICKNETFCCKMIQVGSFHSRRAEVVTAFINSNIWPKNFFIFGYVRSSSSHNVCLSSTQIFIFLSSLSQVSLSSRGTDGA